MGHNIRNITVRGARQHNLKHINVEIPRNRLTVITGLSGSGKSSLAFDTIYAEGQRRYVESLSAYARQFLDRLEPPDVDSIEGLSPAISIEQKTAARSPRSTVGTVTEIYDYLRLLFSSIGIPHCYQCGKPIAKQTPDQIVRHLKALPEGGRVMLLASIEQATKLAKGIVLVAVVDGEERLYSEKMACADCGISIPAIEPRTFSFNSIYGACEVCNGLGMKFDFDPARVITDPTRPILNGGLGMANGWLDEEFEAQVSKIAEQSGADLSLPFEQLPPKVRNTVFYGIKERGNRIEGVVDILNRYYDQNGIASEDLSDLMVTKPCAACRGARLRPESLAVKVASRSI